MAQGDQQNILEEVKERVINILKEDTSETYEEYYDNVINVWQDCANLIPLSANKPEANVKLDKNIKDIETRRLPGTYMEACQKFEEAVAKKNAPVE